MHKSVILHLQNSESVFFLKIILDIRAPALIEVIGLTYSTNFNCKIELMLVNL